MSLVTVVASVAFVGLLAYLVHALVRAEDF